MPPLCTCTICKHKLLLKIYSLLEFYRPRERMATCFTHVCSLSSSVLDQGAFLVLNILVFFVLNTCWISDVFYRLLVLSFILEQSCSKNNVTYLLDRMSRKWHAQTRFFIFYWKVQTLLPTYINGKSLGVWL